MTEPYFVLQDFELYHGDSLVLLQHIVTKVDMIFADPPYFLSTGNGAVNINGHFVKFDKGKWDRVRTDIEKDEFNLQWLSACSKVLKENGTIWVSGTYHNIFSIGRALQKLDFKILNIITWQKTNPPPNFSCRYLTHSTEQIIWARKSIKHKHIYNYELMKKINNDKQMKDVWSFPAISPWEKSCGKHPTQKPLALLVRLILMATNENSIVCDPFSGSGTTGIAANLLGRDFVGIEKEDEFIEIAIRRKDELNENIESIKSKISDLRLLKN